MNDQIRHASIRVDNSKPKEDIIDLKARMIAEVLMPSLESKNGKYSTLWGYKTFDGVVNVVKAIMLSEE